MKTKNIILGIIDIFFALIALANFFTRLLYPQYAVGFFQGEYGFELNQLVSLLWAAIFIVFAIKQLTTKE